MNKKLAQELKEKLEKILLIEKNPLNQAPPMPNRPPKPGKKWKYSPSSGWFQVGIKTVDPDKKRPKVPFTHKPDKYELRAKIDMLRDAMENDFSLAVDIFEMIISGGLQDEERAIMGNLIQNEPDNFLSIMKDIIKDPNFSTKVVAKFVKVKPTQEPKGTKKQPEKEPEKEPEK